MRSEAFDSSLPWMTDLRARVLVAVRQAAKPSRSNSGSALEAMMMPTTCQNTYGDKGGSVHGGEAYEAMMMPSTQRHKKR